jgi:hypothetical protein
MPPPENGTDLSPIIVLIAIQILGGFSIVSVIRSSREAAVRIMPWTSRRQLREDVPRVRRRMDMFLIAEDYETLL